MQGSISYGDLGLIMLFLVIPAIGGYLVITLKNANRFIQEARNTLVFNQEQIHKTIGNLHRITETGVVISREVLESVGKAGKAIEIISRDTTETMLAINKTADDIGMYALVIGEITKVVTRLFVPDRKP